MNKYLGLFHPIKSALAGLGAVAGYLIAWGDLTFEIPLLLVFSSVFLISSGICVLSDYLNLEDDRLENPEKPLPSGTVNKKVARSLFSLQISAGIVISYFIGQVILLVTLAGVILLLIYEYLMKRSTAFYDNLLLGFLMGFIFFYGGLAAGGSMISLIIALVLSLAFVWRSIIKDIELKDKKTISRVTLSSYLGNEFAAWTASAFLVGAVIFTPFIHLLGIFGNNHLFIASIADVLLIYAAIKVTNSPDLGKEARMISEIGIFFLVVSYLMILV